QATQRRRASEAPLYPSRHLSIVHPLSRRRRLGLLSVRALQRTQRGATRCPAQNLPGDVSSFILDIGLWSSDYPPRHVTNAQIVRRNERGHVSEPLARVGARAGLCELHGNQPGGGRLSDGVHDPESLSAPAG